LKLIWIEASKQTIAPGVTALVAGIIVDGKETTGSNWWINFDGNVTWSCSFSIAKELGFSFNTLEPVEIVLKSAVRLFKKSIQASIGDIKCHIDGLYTRVELSGTVNPELI